MRVEITGRHLLVTPALRSYVLRRLRKFTKICGDDASFHVVIDVEKDRHTAEILLKSRRMDLTGKVQTDDMYASIQRAVEKLEKQALKQKSRIIETKRHRAKAEALRERTGQVRRPSRPTPRGYSEIVEEEVRRKPMVLEEAVLELESSEYPFVVFRNSESRSVDVLYRRNDGGLALIRA